MRNHRIAALTAALVFVVVGRAIATAQQALAAAKDYRFELAGPPVNAGKTTLLKIRLIHLPDGKPVFGAVITQTKFDMGPEGMASMTAPAKALVPAEGGIYQVETQPEMAGNWALNLSAKVQGERETVAGTINVPIAK